MARPAKRGLDYFPFDTDFFEDDKIIDLVDAFGTIGVSVYIAALCIVYKEGYYAQMDTAKLRMRVIRKLGYRWNRRTSEDSTLADDVIRRCAELGLFDAALLARGLVTSRSIQERYAAVTKRSKADKSKYWLLDDDEESGRALESAP